MSKETKIGILAVVAIALAVWGYKFIKGSNFLTQDKIFYAEYPDVSGLENSSPVVVNGLKVGTVRGIVFKEGDVKTMVVKMEVKKGLPIPKNTEAKIVSTSIMGGSAVQLIFNTACQGENCAETGDYFKGSRGSLVESMMGVDMDDFKEGVTLAMKNLKDSLLNETTPLGKSVHKLESTISNFENSSKSLDNILKNSAGNIENVLTNADKMTTALNKKTGDLDNIIGNASKFSNQLKDINLASTLQKADNAVLGVTNTLHTVNGSLKKVTNVVDTLQFTVLGKVNDKNSTLGKLLNSDEVSKNLFTKIDSISFMVKDVSGVAADLKKRPYRYIPFKSRKKVLRQDKLDAEMSKQNQR